MYAEALDEADKLGDGGLADASMINTVEIGQKYVEHLISEGFYFFKQVRMSILTSWLLRRICESRAIVSKGLQTRR